MRSENAGARAASPRASESPAEEEAHLRCGANACGRCEVPALPRSFGLHLEIESVEYEKERLLRIDREAMHSIRGVVGEEHHFLRARAVLDRLLGNDLARNPLPFTNVNGIA